MNDFSYKLNSGIVLWEPKGKIYDQPWCFISANKTFSPEKNEFFETTFAESSVFTETSRSHLSDKFQTSLPLEIHSIPPQKKN